MADFQKIEDSKQLVVNIPLSYADGGGDTIVPNWTQRITNLYFQPNFAVLKSVNVMTELANIDDFTYQLNSSLSDDPLCTFTNNNAPPFNPNTIVSIRKPIDQITFRISRVTIPTNANARSLGVAPGTPVLVPPTPAGHVIVSLTFDLISIKDYKSNVFKF
jgi:hypothetical protein